MSRPKRIDLNQRKRIYDCEEIDLSLIAIVLIGPAFAQVELKIYADSADSKGHLDVQTCAQLAKTFRKTRIISRLGTTALPKNI